ncbi:MAG: hypothetical protein KDJ24_11305 [Gammaproteobacteria bacterium]|nr:hypothetical protein [Gammaproteobacteria bacterium]
MRPTRARAPRCSVGTWCLPGPFALSQREPLSVYFTFIAGLTTRASTVIFLAVGRFGSSPSAEQLQRFTFNSATMDRQPALAWWQDYRLTAGALTLLTILLVVAHARAPNRRWQRCGRCERAVVATSPHHRRP